MQYVYGINPVCELLLARKRRCDRVFIAEDKKGKEIDQIIAAAKQRKVAVQRTTKQEIGHLAKTDQHQGVIAKADDFPYSSENNISGDLIIVADGIQDPRNLGSIIRTSYLLGANALAIPEKGSAEVTPVAVKSSSGASERLNIIKVLNIKRLLENCKAKDYWVVCLDSSGEADLWNFDFPKKVLIVIGGEGHGIRNSILKLSDITLKIPMLAQGIGSFNASVAAALSLYEVVRQRARR